MSDDNQKEEPGFHGSNTIRLLLHTVDGAIPYLTPHLLEECFPASKVKDNLWLGISVRDTCICAVMGREEDEQQQEEENKCDQKRGNKKKKKRENHPSGYTFASDVTLDPWLLQYTRITVPTLDPYEDAKQFSYQKIANKTTIQAAAGDGSRNDHCVMVWTDNGRQKLSTELYEGAVRGLQSQASVTMFDVFTTDAKDKRRRIAFQRTTQGHQQQKQQQKDQQQRKVWLACLVTDSSVVVAKGGNHDNHRRPEGPEVEQQFTSIRQAISQEDHTNNENKRVNDNDDNIVVVDGLAFVGPAIGTPESLQKAIHRIQQHPEEGEGSKTTTTTTPLPNLSVLSTNSLTHFLDCYQVGIHILGTNLPATWSKSHKALACDIWNWRTETNTNKRPKLEEMDADCCYEITKEWIRDKRPIMEGCTCLTCQQHSRAYLYHLVQTKELLSGILLFIHNLHHMLSLCQELSKAKREGKGEEIVRHIKKQMKPAE